MRIQHNIMAMNAYRNYTNNVSAMQKNLEKLSSGYKINRAGDDAAGLAISEKMRAQISGLEAAQKNAKDGISLVQTAEGALTEVHDMLNRMVTLATQSANGTYDNTTDRYQLQKEVNQLMEEINRIADSSNFNGIKLLDGSMATDAAKITGDARIIPDVYTSGKAAELSGTKTFLDGEVATPSTKTVFEVDFTGLKAKVGPASKTYEAVDPAAVDGVTATVDANTAGVGDVNVKIDKVAANKAAEGVGADDLADITKIAGGDTDNSKLNGYSVVFNVVADAGDAKAVIDDDAKTITVSLAKNGGASNDGKYTAANINTLLQAAKKADGTASTAITAGDLTVTSTAGIDVGSKTAGAELGSIELSGGAAAGDMTVTLTSAAGTDTETYTAAQWTGTVNVTGTKSGVSAAITAASVTASVADTKIGEVTQDTNVDFTLTIAGTEFTVNSDTSATGLADKGDAAAIATAVSEALETAATAEGGPGTGKAVINGNTYDFTYTAGDSKITFTLADEPTEKNIAANFDWDVKGLGTDTFDGNHTAGVKVTTPGSVYKDAPTANTVFKLEAADIKDGAQITIDGTTVTLAVGKNSAYKNNLSSDGKGTVAANAGGSGYIDLTMMEDGSVDLNQAISKISEGFKNGTTNFIVGTNDTSNKDTHPGLTVHKKATSGEIYDTKAKLASVFEITKEAGKGLALQIGDTADSFNQLRVSITDCHTSSLGISGVDISTQEGAQAAVSAIKDAINKVSDVRGTLGATQNRLDHTINNLSVMTENIQDAESTIRDVDVAEEMMAYTKNNILIQSAQAMLAQANQVPQGVLQLLG